MKKWGAMEGVTKASSFPSLHRHFIISRRDPIPRKAFEIPWRIVSPSCRQRSKPKIVRGAITREEGAISLPEKKKKEEKKEKFSWYEQWYPVAPVCDLDKRRPQGKKVIGIEVVVWWDRNDQAWKVFDDNCPHRLAPLSEGRIDAKGRLQCVYHGWCYGGAGDCKFIPQAHPDGPRVENSSKACVGVYPSCVQNGIVWFWPNLEAEYKDIHMKKKPPYIPELDDPSYTKGMSSREAPYSYEILVQNLVDISHVPYAHHGLLSIFDKPTSESKGERDREGGGPLRLDVGRIDVSGYSAKLGETGGFYNFTAPCLYTASYSFSGKKVVLAFLCVPVSPHESRVIFASPRNFGTWMDRIIPRWVHHIGENMVFDSDLHLLMVEDRRLTSVGSRNWHKACYVPTKADAMVVAFRRWLNTYGGAEVDWRHKENAVAPPPRIPPREQLFDRYWTHTVNCSSCRVAYERLTALHIALHFFSVASVAVAAAVKHKRYSLLLSVVAVMCFAASKWLEHFVYKTFRYHDYDHAFQLS